MKGGEEGREGLGKGGKGGKDESKEGEREGRGTGINSTAKVLVQPNLSTSRNIMVSALW